MRCQNRIHFSSHHRSVGFSKNSREYRTGVTRDIDKSQVTGPRINETTDRGNGQLWVRGGAYTSFGKMVSRGLSMASSSTNKDKYIALLSDFVVRLSNTRSPSSSEWVSHMFPWRF